VTLNPSSFVVILKRNNIKQFANTYIFSSTTAQHNVKEENAAFIQ
jgi:hypothetical protein